MGNARAKSACNSHEQQQGLTGRVDALTVLCDTACIHAYAYAAMYKCEPCNMQQERV